MWKKTACLSIAYPKVNLISYKELSGFSTFQAPYYYYYYFIYIIKEERGVT
jgi:hypothetical protein